MKTSKKKPAKSASRSKKKSTAKKKITKGKMRKLTAKKTGNKKSLSSKSKTKKTKKISSKKTAKPRERSTPQSTQKRIPLSNVEQQTPTQTTQTQQHPPGFSQSSKTTIIKKTQPTNTNKERIIQPHNDPFDYKKKQQREFTLHARQSVYRNSRNNFSSFRGHLTQPGGKKTR